MSTAAGRRRELPDLIEPWQPFKDMRAITHTAIPGVTVECIMEGDTFEMEDQRNWSDAPTRPMFARSPCPGPTGYRQVKRSPSGSFWYTDKRAKPSSTSVDIHQPPVILAPGERRGRMPAIGIVVTPEEADAVLEPARLMLAEINPQELLFHFDPAAGHDAQAFKRFAAVAKSSSRHIDARNCLALQTARRRGNQRDRGPDAGRRLQAGCDHHIAVGRSAIDATRQPMAGMPAA
jgi:hypothetical protein